VFTPLSSLMVLPTGICAFSQRHGNVYVFRMKINFFDRTVEQLRFNLLSVKKGILKVWYNYLPTASVPRASPTC
jgi:hypothetical protein